MDGLDEITGGPGLQQDEHEPSDEPGEARSLLDQLRGRRDELAADAAPTLLLDIPRYEGRLVARYRYPAAGYKAISSAVRKANDTKDTDAILNSNLSALVHCCDGILGRDGDEYIDLRTNLAVDAESEDLPRFADLAEMFGIDVPDQIKARAAYVARHVFSPRAAATGVYDGDLAAMTQAGEVLQWLSTAGEESIAELAGE